jgi:hypothetical protein
MVASAENCHMPAADTKLTVTIQSGDNVNCSIADHLCMRSELPHACCWHQADCHNPHDNPHVSYTAAEHLCMRS